MRQEALLRALREKWIAGAALDTHYHYPMPPDHPLWQFPNVIFTPHISGSSLSPRFKKRLWEIFSINVDVSPAANRCSTNSRPLNSPARELINTLRAIERGLDAGRLSARARRRTNLASGVTHGDPFHP